MKLVQKQFLKETREFELADDVIDVRIKTPFREEKLSVVLAVLNPEPVENGPFLEFHSRVKCGPLFCLRRDRPSAGEFNAFVEALTRRAREEYHAFAGLREGASAEGLAANSYEDPPEIDDPGINRSGRTGKPVNVASVDNAVRMLRQHLDTAEIGPFVSALEALAAAPEDETGFRHLVKAFDELGSRQGAVLTYAPYVGVLLSEGTPGH